MRWTRTEATELVRPYGQEHVLSFWHELTAHQQAQLLDQIASVDLDWLDRAATGALAPIARGSIAPFEDLIPLDSPSQSEALRTGDAALRAGRVATLLVAGGQGTRLGFDGPKGSLPLGPVSGRTLFQIHAQRQLALGLRYGVIPPLYVMTSPDNHDATVAAFERQAMFGLPADRVMIFPQGLAPAVDARGKLLLASKHELVLAPNGNGGLFAALRDSGALQHMRSQGIDTVSYIQVDNPLSRSCDSRFVGHHLLCQSAFSCKAIAKRSPEEKVGHYARVDGRLAIVEYGELSEELARQRDAAGRLSYGYANPGLFLWSRDFIESQAARKDLPVHRAHKTIPHVDSHGQLVRPEHPNGYKLELFALDTLPTAQTAIVVECVRAEEFAPVKNQKGADSAESARAMLAQLHRRWIEAAGAEIAVGCQVEISSLFALDEAELARKVPEGYVFEQRTYLDRDAVIPRAIGQLLG